MSRFRPGRAVLLATLALAPAAVSPAAAAPQLLQDSTFVDTWTLANGLRVVARHVPRANAVSISVAYASGSASDPAGREGLTRLLAEVQFTAPAGQLPDRTRQELDSQRPLGWHVKVLPRAVVMTEAATVAQFPAVLQQVAWRVAGVRVTEPVLEEAVARVREDLRRIYVTSLDSLAYALPSDVAMGLDDDALGRLAHGGGLGRLSVREVERLLRERFAPAATVLSLAGDLGGFDVRAFVEREFGGLPGGTVPVTPQPVLRRAARTLPVAGLREPIGALGVIAPPLDDPEHPKFYLAALLMGSRALSLWGPALPPLSTRFKYALFDDPDLVRFYPPTDPLRTDTAWVAARLDEVIDPLWRMPYDPEVVDGLKRGVYWLLGGPMMPEVVRRARNDPAVLYHLSTSAATRTLWGGEGFWSDYRRRFAEIADLPLDTWVDYATSPRLQVRLVLSPAPR